MTNNPGRTALQSALLATLFALSLAVDARTQAEAPRRDVDIVIALDVSGSMSALIESAKQRLWDITNELGRAQPTPVLRVAILSYGKPGYGAQSGYVRVDLPFTNDLDAVNETLFSFTTAGGAEYVARALHTSLQSLQWSTRDDALRIIFVAGNESAEQDPKLGLEQVLANARQRDVIVNAIYCGNDGAADAHGWQRVAELTDGFYASIDQNVAAIANFASPMDAPLAALNEELNSTYLAYGEEGVRAQEKQLEQDAKVAALSAPAAASRAVTKGSALYRPSWDLVDALAAGASIRNFAAAQMPAEMQAMSTGEQEAYVQEQAEKRETLRQRIATLDDERRVYLTEKRREAESDGPKGLDTVMMEGIRRIAGKRGFTFQQ